MKKLMMVTLLIAMSGYYAYATNKPNYSILTVETIPVPTQVYFTLWERLTVQICQRRAERYNIESSECEVYVTEQTLKCKDKIPAELPAFIDNEALGKQVVFDYFACISPASHDHSVIAGVWVSTAKGGEVIDNKIRGAIYTFYPDETFTLTTFLTGKDESFKGEYKLGDAMIEITIAGQTPQRMPYSIEEGVLRIEAANHESWFEFEKVALDDYAS